DGGHGAVHTRHAHVQFMGLREGTQRHEGGDNRDAGVLGEGEQFLVGVRLDHTATDVENRLFCLTDELDGLLDLTGVRNGDRAVTRQVDLGWPDEVEFGVLDVLGDVHQNRSRAAGDGKVECLGQGLGDGGGVGDHEVVLGHRHGDATDIGFLEGVGTQEAAADLTGDGDHWNRVQVRIGDRGDQVGGTGSGGGDTDTDATGDLCITG